jgi:hypothetical protein
VGCVSNAQANCLHYRHEKVAEERRFERLCVRNPPQHTRSSCYTEIKFGRPAYQPAAAAIRINLPEPRRVAHCTFVSLFFARTVGSLSQQGRGCSTRAPETPQRACDAIISVNT